MSVYAGRKTRQLYDPEAAMFHFQKTEGTALPPRSKKCIPNSLLALLLIMIVTSCTTFAIYNKDEMLTFLGFASIFIIGIIYFCRICT
tara:strand:- start:120 stop:383 length:264 start_codon:yes stop_codon:yes gene_type:complete